jgi:alginate O-acetyltransferase complex protein AlgI
VVEHPLGKGEVECSIHSGSTIFSLGLAAAADKNDPRLLVIAMLFQSQFFILVFLPLTIFAYYAASGSTAVRQTVLIVASLFFYGWWDFRFVPLLIGQIGATWLLAVLAARMNSKLPLFTGIFINLMSLGTFKYFDFLVKTLEALSGVTLTHTNFVLPIGISFFSFQLISYLVDRLRNDAPIYPFRPFALFVMFFPHLIAGPIVRHNELIPQFSADPRGSGLWHRIGVGLILFTLGFAKKVLLGDVLAGTVNKVFADASVRTLDFGEAWTGALGFSLQLFLDFSAYTEMAIGIALLFGLVLPENFRRPYLASDLSDFWRRWHISLSRFMRDYLYIPLGGSRAGWVHYVIAAMITMGLCGLWHGAGWTFVVWGLWHGFGLIVSRAWKNMIRPMPRILGWGITSLFVLVGWVLFRAADIGTAASVICSLGGLSGIGGKLQDIPLLAIAAAVSVLVPSAHEIKERVLKPQPIVAAIAAVVALICIFRVGKEELIPFIYFQF